MNCKTLLNTRRENRVTLLIYEREMYRDNANVYIRLCKNVNTLFCSFVGENITTSRLHNVSIVEIFHTIYR